MSLKPRSFFYLPMRKLASGCWGVVIALSWGVVEALFWPIVPDVFVFSASLAAPKRWWRLALFASAGSVAGGCIGFWAARALPGHFPVASLPLVLPSMVTRAGAWLQSQGASSLLRQPMSGIPYKVFVYLSGDAHLGFVGFVWYSILARSLRIFGFAAFSALLGALGGEKRWSRWYDIFIGSLLVIFGLGLARIVTSS